MIIMERVAPIIGGYLDGRMLNIQDIWSTWEQCWIKTANIIQSSTITSHKYSTSEITVSTTKVTCRPNAIRISPATRCITPHQYYSGYIQRTRAPITIQLGISLSSPSLRAESVTTHTNNWSQYPHGLSTTAELATII